jgi:hypothetical protein
MIITQEDIDFAKCLEKESIEALDNYARKNKLNKFLEVWDSADEINRKAILYKLISINKLVNAKLKSKAKRWLKKHELPN